MSANGLSIASKGCRPWKGDRIHILIPLSRGEGDGLGVMLLGTVAWVMSAQSSRGVAFGVKLRSDVKPASWDELIAYLAKNAPID